MHIVLCTLSSVGVVPIQISANKLQYTISTNQTHITAISLSVFLSTNIFIKQWKNQKRFDVIQIFPTSFNSLHIVKQQNCLEVNCMAQNWIGRNINAMTNLILSYWKHKAFCFRIVQGKMLHTNTQHTTGYCSVTCLIFFGDDVKQLWRTPVQPDQMLRNTEKVDFTLHLTAD